MVKKEENKHKKDGSGGFDWQGVGILVRRRQVRIGGEKKKKTNIKKIIRCNLRVFQIISKLLVNILVQNSKESSFIDE